MVRSRQVDDVRKFHLHPFAVVRIGKRDRVREYIALGIAASRHGIMQAHRHARG